jgi:hypothetical protein
MAVLTRPVPGYSRTCSIPGKLQGRSVAARLSCCFHFAVPWPLATLTLKLRICGSRSRHGASELLLGPRRIPSLDDA